MRGTLDLSSWNYNKLNSYNTREDYHINTQTHLRDLDIKASEGGRIRQARKEERGESEDSGQEYKLELPMELQDREGIRLPCTLFAALEHSCQSNQHILWQNPVIRAVTYRDVTAVF